MMDGLQLILHSYLQGDDGVDDGGDDDDGGGGDDR